MTDGKPIPEDVWQAILRLEAKRIRQAEANPTFHMDEALERVANDYDDDYDDEPSDQDMMASFGTKWHDAL